MTISTGLFAKLLGLFICTFFAFMAKGQSDVTTPDLQDDGSKLVVKYNIINSKPGDKFFIELVITDEDGNVVDASSFTGDIGPDINGGHNKIITWDYKNDGVFYETEVTVNVKYKWQNRKTEVPPSMIPPSTKSYTRSGLILQSLAVPGLGMTKLKGKPYWLYGVVGYGLIGTSIYYSSKADSFWYDEYEPYPTKENYNQYDKLLTTSLVLACGAAAIWLTDLVLISVSSKKMNQYGFRKIHIVPGFDYRTKTPMLSMTYRF